MLRDVDGAHRPGEPIRWSAREAQWTMKVAGATECDPAPAFVDDLVLVVLGLRAVAEALILIAIIEAWESGAGVYVPRKILLYSLWLRNQHSSPDV